MIDYEIERSGKVIILFPQSRALWGTLSDSTIRERNVVARRVLTLTHHMGEGEGKKSRASNRFPNYNEGFTRTFAELFEGKKYSSLTYQWNQFLSKLGDCIITYIINYWIDLVNSYRIDFFFSQFFDCVITYIRIWKERMRKQARL